MDSMVAGFERQLQTVLEGAVLLLEAQDVGVDGDVGGGSGRDGGAGGGRLRLANRRATGAAAGRAAVLEPFIQDRSVDRQDAFAPFLPGAGSSCVSLSVCSCRLGCTLGCVL